MSLEPAPSVAPPPHATITVARWPSELPLAVCVALASVGIWILLAVSILGLVYATLLAVFFFFVQVSLVTYLRGTAVRLGPEQFPELHARIVELAGRAGLPRIPEAYLLQAGGSLNAFATRFLRQRMVALYTDLVEACGDDRAARDMVIGHELGHLRCRHLDFAWLMLPGMLVPFLGAAYSRARELTCDRWGAALCGDPQGAVRGLAILAAGGRLGPQVNLRAYVAQRRDLDTGWMTLGRWLGSYPPLSERVEAIRPELGAGLVASPRGPLRALAILLLAGLLPAAGLAGGAFLFSQKLAKLVAPGGSGGAAPSWDSRAAREEPAAEVDPARLARVQEDLTAIEGVLRDEWQARGELPADGDALVAAWDRWRPGEPFPTDPFDGTRYGYVPDEEGEALVFSSGPDAQPATADDIDHPVTVGGD